MAVTAAAKFLGNQARLARALGVTPVTVGQWLKPAESGGRGVAAKQCVRIEKLTQGLVTRQDLRPDDWQDIWPELVVCEQKLPVAQANHAPAAIETVAADLPLGV